MRFLDEYHILKKKKNKKSGFAATALLTSIAVILLLVGLFVFLLGRVNKNKVVKNDVGTNNTAALVDDNGNTSIKECDKDGNCTIISCSTKEQVFMDNLGRVKDAAVSYYTNERLPQKLGETKKMTLKEMQDKKLVLSIVDSNRKTCSNDKSYVEIKKEKNEYVMKVYLSCSDMEDYILIHLGCYDYCKDNVCEKQVVPDVTEYEYEYKKTTPCTMTSWSNWSAWKTTREATSSNKKEDTKVVTTLKTIVDVKDATSDEPTYSCDEYGKDYKLEDKLCVKKTTKIETSEPKKVEDAYVCPEGTIKNGTKCEREIEKTDTKAAKEKEPTYNCKDYPGYDLVGSKCVLISTINEEKDALPGEPTYNCKDYPGYDLVGSNCVKEDTKDATKVEGSYTCSTYGDDYKLNGDKCVKTYQDKVSVDYKEHEKTVKKDCQIKECTTQLVFDEDTMRMVPHESCVFKPGKCDEKVKVKVCPAIESNGKCFKYVQKTDTKDAKKTATTYNCNAYPGYTQNDKTCVYLDTKPATKNTTSYSCASYGSDFKLVDENKCVKTYQVTKEEKATQDKIGYTCKDYGKDYVLKGQECVKNYKDIETTPAIKVPEGYTCEDGYGYNSKTKTCEKTIITIKEKDAKEIEGAPTCPEGYDLDGNECKKTTQEEVQTTYYRYAVRTCVGGTSDVKWSYENNTNLLNLGYKMTGKKRAIKVTEK